ncbi:thiamine-phosphate kinase [Chloroflexota bacterium]
MKVSELGEFGLIDLLAGTAAEAQDKGAEAWQKLILGIGDDAAAWQGDASIQLATVDSLIQDVHFSLGLTSWEELGWRAMAANLSDIAAMGGVPRYALVSLALPGHTEVVDVTALYKGMIELARRFEVAIVGGDTGSAPIVIVNITILGSTKGGGKHLLTRSAARAGEKVAVTGYLGAASAGLKMLTENLRFDAEAANSLKEAFLKPHPRIAEGQILIEHGVKAAIDTSDGLVSDLGHICKVSRVSARIEVDRIPVQSAVEANFGDRALELALSGGGGLRASVYRQRRGYREGEGSGLLPDNGNR